MNFIVSELTVSEQYEFVIGVDTHAATHTFALVAAATGRSSRMRNSRPAQPGWHVLRPGSSGSASTPC